MSGGELTGNVTAGGIKIRIDASLIGSELNGTYAAVQAGACTGDTGTLVATR